MIHIKYRLITCLLIPFLFLNLSVNTMFRVAHTMEESGHLAAHKVSISNVMSNDHCPACPDEDHPETDHSHSSCEHHSSIYFGYTPQLITYNPIISLLGTTEPSNSFPDVYLEKFIPPERFV